MTFFDAQRGQRLEAVRLDAERRRMLDEPLPQGHTAIGRHIQLVRQLAGETQAQHPQRRTVHQQLAAAHVRQGRIREILAG